MLRVGLLVNREKSCVRDVLDGVAQFLDQLPATERWECWNEFDLEHNELRPIVLDGALVMTYTRRDARAAMKLAPKLVGVLGCPSLGFPFPSVACDDVEVGRIAAKELLRRGHRDLVFIASPGSERFDHHRDRLRGFASEADAAGVRCRVGPGRMTLRAFMRGLPRPCGVLAITDETGKFVLDVCRAEKIRVPQEISVLGVDNDLQTCELCWPPLATVTPGHFEVGFEAAKRLHALMTGGDSGAAGVEVVGTPEIVIRASVDTRAVDDELVAEALQFISTHAHESLSVPSLCEALGAGRRSLEVRMKRATGRSVLQELNAARIQIAKRLLRNRRLSILQVARLSGFGTLAHFGVVFRRTVGTTPTLHRRRVMWLDPPGLPKV